MSSSCKGNPNCGGLKVHFTDDIVELDHPEENNENGTKYDLNAEILPSNQSLLGRNRGFGEDHSFQKKASPPNRVFENSFF